MNFIKYLTLLIIDLFIIFVFISCDVPFSVTNPNIAQTPYYIYGTRILQSYSYDLTLVMVKSSSLVLNY